MSQLPPCEPWSSASKQSQDNPPHPKGAGSMRVKQHVSIVISLFLTAVADITWAFCRPLILVLEGLFWCLKKTPFAQASLSPASKLLFCLWSRLCTRELFLAYSYCCWFCNILILVEWKCIFSRTELPRALWWKLIFGENGVKARWQRFQRAKSSLEVTGSSSVADPLSPVKGEPSGSLSWLGACT